MREELRQATALLAAVLFGERGYSAVYDVTTEQRLPFDVTEAEALAAGQIASAYVTDLARHGQLLVEGRRPSYQAFDATGGGILTLELGPHSFRGHDSASGSFFEGRLAGATVEIFDHGDDRVHHYLLLPSAGERRG